MKVVSPSCSDVVNGSFAVIGSSHKNISAAKIAFVVHSDYIRCRITFCLLRSLEGIWNGRLEQSISQCLSLQEKLTWKVKMIPNKEKLE